MTVVLNLDCLLKINVDYTANKLAWIENNCAILSISLMTINFSHRVSNLFLKFKYFLLVTGRPVRNVGQLLQKERIGVRLVEGHNRRVLADKPKWFATGTGSYSESLVVAEPYLNISRRRTWGEIRTHFAPTDFPF